MRALFLVEGAPERGLSPASRFRVYQLVPHLERQGIQCHVVPSVPPKYWLNRLRFAQKLNNRPGLMLAALAAESTVMTASRWPWIRRAVDYDAIVLQRDLLPLGTLTPFLERALIRRNPKVVFDFDDAIFLSQSSAALPSESRFLGIRDADKIGHIIQDCRHVIAGNAYLAEYARRWNRNVSIIPTVIDTDRYIPVPRKPERHTLTIGWTGTHGNLIYVQRLSPVLQRLAREFRIRLRLICNRHTVRLDFGSLAVEFRDWRLATEVEDLQEFDIGLMPLPDDEWARGKCGAKALLYMACGIPCVVSPVGVNGEIISSGTNGFTARTDADWFEALHALITDSVLRRRMGDAARETVVSRYSVERWAPEVASVLRRVGKDSAR